MIGTASQREIGKRGRKTDFSIPPNTGLYEVEANRYERPVVTIRIIRPEAGESFKVVSFPLPHLQGSSTISVFQWIKWKEIRWYQIKTMWWISQYFPISQTLFLPANMALRSHAAVSKFPKVVVFPLKSNWFFSISFHILCPAFIVSSFDIKSKQ